MGGEMLTCQHFFPHVLMTCPSCPAFFSFFGGGCVFFLFLAFFFSIKPCNAEAPIQLIADSLTTPNALFFIRNHLPVPDIKVQDYTLQVGGVGLNDVTLTLADLKTKFKPHTITGKIASKFSIAGRPFTFA